MKHTDILKRAFQISWRYRALWLFGFLLALCSGGSGGSGNFRMPSGGGNSGNFNLPGGEKVPVPNVDPGTILAIVGVVICLVLLLAVVSVVVRTVARTALIGMVRQITQTEAVTIGDGWRFGWSNRAWRVFLVELVIGIPVAIVTIILLLLAFSPLLLLLYQDSTGSMVVAIMLTVIGVIFVALLLIVIGAIIAPVIELAWRGVTLTELAVGAGIRNAVQLIRQNFKDVLVIWLLLMGVGLLWVFISLIVVLPVSLLAALVLGGLPAALVYVVSNSWIGAAVAGVPLAIIALVLVNGVASAFYLTFQSAVWTLTFLELPQPALAGETQL